MKISEIKTGNSLKYDYKDEEGKERTLIGTFVSVPKGKEEGLFIGYIKGLNEVKEYKVLFANSQKAADEITNNLWDYRNTYGMVPRNFSPTRMPKVISDKLKRAVREGKKVVETKNKIKEYEKEIEKLHYQMSAEGAVLREELEDLDEVVKLNSRMDFSQLTEREMTRMYLEQLEQLSTQKNQEATPFYFSEKNMKYDGEQIYGHINISFERELWGEVDGYESFDDMVAMLGQEAPVKALRETAKRITEGDNGIQVIASDYVQWDVDEMKYRPFLNFTLGLRVTDYNKAKKVGKELIENIHHYGIKMSQRERRSFW